MNKPDTSRTMRHLATEMRQHAQETALPEYQIVLQRTAYTLDAEADLIAEQQSQEFARVLRAFSESQFTTRYH